MDTTGHSHEAGSGHGGRMPRWLSTAVALVAVGVALYALRAVLTPVFFAFLVAYMLDPLVDRLEARRVPRGLGIGILLTAFLGAVALFLLLVAPGVVSEVVGFTAEVPQLLADAMTRTEPWLEELGVQVPGSVSEAFTTFELDMRDVAGKAVAPAGAALGWLVGGTASALGALVGLLMVPVFAAYILYDFDRMIAGVRDLIPWRFRGQVVQIATEVDEILGQFVRGQITVMVALAVLYAVGYSLAGVRLAVPIGIAAGLLSFIPYVGGAVALGLALLMCGLHWEGWMQLVWVGLVYGVIQVLEGFVITPRVVGDKVGLPAVWVLLALMIGGELFGFMGVLLALPAAAVVKIFVLHGMAWYRRSELFRGGAPATPVGEGGQGEGDPAPGT